ncbi:MAG: tetratricopeptide repeat protein [Deltaproteobacteria bacterium]|nr:tetratricopeptide repeat protein [Deltaproteobacteria bacterium]
MPLPNLPAPREAIPQPNLPVPRSAVQRVDSRIPATPIALARINLGASQDRERTPEPTSASPLTPLNLGASAQGRPAPALDGLDLDLSPDMDLPPTTANGGATILGIGGVPKAAAGAPGLDLDLLSDMSDTSPSAHTRGLPDLSVPVQPGEQTIDGGLGFRLDIEGAHAQNPSSPSTTVVPSSALPAIEVNAMGVLEDAIPELSPHRAEGGPEQTKRRRPINLRLLGGIGAALALVTAAAIFFILPMLKRGASPDTTLAPFAAQLERDSFPSYKQAAAALLQQAAIESKGDELRAQAAELLLLARIARGAPKSAMLEAEQALSQILQTPEPTQVERRARALLEVAQGKPQRAEPLLAGIEDSVGARLIIGFKQMASGSPASAASTFEIAVSQQPGRLLPQYMLARAYEAAGQTQKANAAFTKVAAANPQHVAAALGALRTQDLKPTILLEKLERLAVLNATDASGAEIAAVHVLKGRTAAALGKTAIPNKAYAQALAADPGNVDASIALSETLLAEGRFNEALARAQSVAIEATKKLDGLFALGGAQIATHRASEGLPLIEKALPMAPRDPRGPFFKAWAAEEAVNPDLRAAEEQYAQALKLTPAFVPASLRLAALLQRTNRAADSLKILKAAENAGAPSSVLQIAWGQALIVAKQPDRAEQVFRKVLSSDPALTAARLGLASSLEAQGRVGEAKLELDELLVQSPNTDGLRERLAALSLQLGEKDEAMSQYEAALASGKAGPEVQVAIGRLALQMGNLEKAAKHLEKVVEDAPQTPGALFGLGQLREKQGELGKAIGEYRRATSYENTPEVQLAFGKVLNQAGKEDDAMVAFREAFALAEAHLEHGRVLLKRAKPDKAISDFTAAVGIDPELFEAYLLMGNAHDTLGESDKAADAWRNVVRLQPKHTEALYKLGRLLMDRSQSKQALEYLRRASADVPEDKPWAADVFFQLGFAELQAGSRKNAAEALTKYLTLAPTDAPDRPAVEKQLERLK